MFDMLTENKDKQATQEKSCCLNSIFTSSGSSKWKTTLQCSIHMTRH